MGQVSGRRPLCKERSRLAVLLPTSALLIICLSPMAFAQADTCSKPRVAVQLTGIHDEVIELLNSKGVPQPRESWILQIQDKVLEELRMGSPGTVFVQVDGVGGALPTACDYGFEYLIHFIAAGEEIEVWGGALESEYTAYYMSSELAQNNPCEGPDTVDVEMTKKDEDVFQTIEHNIETWGDIGRRIEEFERSHPVPPRGPELHISQDPEFVSPLKAERELDIKIDVTDCRGEVVYEKSHGQKITLPRKTDRNELSGTHRFPQRVRVLGDMLFLYALQPEGTSATYTLKSGVEPHVESIEITTCGIDTKIVKKDTQIHIRGLKLRVTPEKTTISPGERTDIKIELSKVDDKGNKEPLPGKQIELDIRGLVDGDVWPSGDITTDDDGKAVLVYSAGENDQKVTFSAKFQPKNYDEFVHDEKTVGVFLPRLRAIVHHTITTSRNFSEIKPEFYNSTKQSNSKEHRNFEIHLTGAKNPRIDYEFDKESLKMKIRSYRYEIESARIQSASLEGQISTHDKEIDTAGIRHEWRCSYSSSGTDFQLESQSSRPSIEIKIDPSTGLITTVHLPSYKVTGIINHESDCSGVKRQTVGNYENLVPYDQNETRTSDLNISVEPTVDDRENCWNVADTKNTAFLRGECGQIREKKYLTEEETYEWEVIIRKNNP